LERGIDEKGQPNSDEERNSIFETERDGKHQRSAKPTNTMKTKQLCDIIGVLLGTAFNRQTQRARSGVLTNLGDRIIFILLASTLIGLALTALPSLAQSTYEPYTFTTLAGLAGSPGSTDATGSDARFREPWSVAVDSAGNVYVADSGNNTIRKGYPENVPAVIVTSAPGFGFKGGQFGFNLTGPVGRFVVVEASRDLVSWLPVWTNNFAGTLKFSDPQSGIYSNRFYRAHLP
jgi:DNA-binding beta-propeller fold protein YncE